MYRRVFLLSYKMHERHGGCESERVQGWMCAKRFVLLQFTFGSGTSKKVRKSKITHGNYQQRLTLNE